MSSPWWQPKNATERAMAEAVATGESAEFLRAAVAAELYLPQVLKEDAVLQPGAEEWVPLTQQVSGQPAIPLFTSLAGMGAAVVVGRYSVTSFAEVRDRWAGPGWWVAINPGLPIDAYLPFDAVDRLISGELVAVDGQLVRPGEAPAEDDDEDAAGAPVPQPADPDRPHTREEVMAALLDSTVIVPTSREADYPDELLTPEFPWLRSGSADAPRIEVFTDERRALARAAWPSVRMPFLLLMIAWPDGHALTVDPGSRGGLECSPDEVSQLQQLAIAARGE